MTPSMIATFRTGSREARKARTQSMRNRAAHSLMMKRSSVETRSPEAA